LLVRDYLVSRLGDYAKQHVSAKTLEEADIPKLLKAAGEGQLYLVILLAVTTGMRRGEILALRWRDIDFDGGNLAVRQTLEKTKSGLSFKEPKTQKSRRVIAIPQLAIEP
jgi:integrase